jgi:hypothetical protein
MSKFTNDSSSLAKWIEYVFEHPVTDPAWHLAVDAPEWEGPPALIAAHIAETFEQSAHLLARFSDEQLDQGFRFLLDAGGSEFMFSLVQADVPAEVRFRALRSFVPLFDQVMALRCSPYLSHLDEPGAKPLNGICYMWWDVLPIHGRPDVPERRNFDAEVVIVLERLLAIPHDACRESALHGIGHWSIYYPNVAGVIDNFLARTPGLRPQLVAYAQSAKTGVL